ncbi:MAG TPA: hypothetical protein PK711_04480 [Bacteroidales bacterium]|nr:hypothetical protein [Bacteroidales bacterium]HRZ20332.1 hypothetical protein [Bacteroidales bacterium]
MKLSMTNIPSLPLLLLWTILSPLSGFLMAQDVEVKARLGNDAILIGDQTTLTLEAIVPSSCRIVWPVVGDTLIRQVEVVKKSAVDTVRLEEPAGGLKLTQQLIITSFDSGYFAIPPFLFMVQMPGATDYQVGETEAMLLQVDNPQVNLADDIKDIKGPLKAPVTFAEIWPWLLAGILIAGAVFLYFYYLRRRKKEQPLVTFRRRPAQPPHLIALDELEKLKTKKLWQSGKVKQYHSELTGIIRAYISARFGVHAVEMVTHEILESMEKTPVNPSTRSKLKEMLELADLVKFAKENPLPDEQERSMSHAFDVVMESAHAGESIPEETNDRQTIPIGEDQKTV